MNAKDALGQQGEQLAADYLQRAGFRILARNWRCSRGRDRHRRGRPPDPGRLRGQDQLRHQVRHPARGRHQEEGAGGCGGWPCAGCSPTASLFDEIRVDVVGVLKDEPGDFRSSTFAGWARWRSPAPTRSRWWASRAIRSRSRRTSRTGWSACCSSGCPIPRCARRGTGSGRPSSTAASSGRTAGSPSGLSPASLPKRGQRLRSRHRARDPGRGRGRPAAGLAGTDVPGRARPRRPAAPGPRRAARGGGRRGRRASGPRRARRERSRGVPGAGHAGRRRAQPGRAAERGCAARRRRPRTPPVVEPGAGAGARGRDRRGQRPRRPGPEPGPAAAATWPTWSASRPPGGPPRSARRAVTTCCCSGRRAWARPCWPSGCPTVLPPAGAGRRAGGHRDPLDRGDAAAGQPAADRAAVLRAASHLDQGGDRRRRQRHHAGPARPRWRTTAACSWTRHRSSPGTCSTRCASRWSPARW